jgi:hypothetical protein
MVVALLLGILAQRNSRHVDFYLSTQYISSFHSTESSNIEPFH